MSERASKDITECIKFYGATPFKGLMAVVDHVIGQERFLDQLSLAEPKLLAAILGGNPTLKTSILCAGMGVPIPISVGEEEACKAVIQLLRGFMTDAELRLIEALLLGLGIRSYFV